MQQKMSRARWPYENILNKREWTDHSQKKTASTKYVTPDMPPDPPQIYILIGIIFEFSICTGWFCMCF